ncbi:MAG: hypothetical protein H7138_18335 [Myxococcales bacterium]|nr:hypothetical protein [Myxococcales bacterium]
MSAVVITSVCLGLLYVVGTSLARDGRRRARPVVRIADCREGDRVKLVGHLVALEPLSAPMTGRDCVAYSVMARDGFETTVIDAVVMFAIDDGSGHAIVHCGRAGAAITLDLHPGPYGHGIFKTFRSEAMPGPGKRGHGGEVLSESVLLPGDRVAVFGEVQLFTEPGTTAQSGYRDGSVTRVKIVRPRFGDFLVTATPYFLGAVPSATR